MANYTISQIELPNGDLCILKDSNSLQKNSVINSLNNTATDLPLSAAKGKELNDNLTALTTSYNSLVIPTKTSDLINDSNFLTSFTETDPTVPAWAKAATKPTYTAAEVGAVARSGDTMTGSLTVKSTGLALTDATRGNLSIILHVAQSGNFGIYSNGYYNGSSFISDAKWLLYRDTNNVIRLGNAVSVDNGGTGATTAASARTNLGITPANIGAVTKSGDTMTGTLTAPAFFGPLVLTAPVGNFDAPGASIIQLRNDSSGTNPSSILGGNQWLILTDVYNNDSYSGQLAIGFQTGMAWRGKVGTTTWGDWRKIAFADDTAAAPYKVTINATPTSTGAVLIPAANRNDIFLSALITSGGPGYVVRRDGGYFTVFNNDAGKITTQVTFEAYFMPHNNL